jgi:hypothetical protein
MFDKFVLFCLLWRRLWADKPECYFTPSIANCSDIKTMRNTMWFLWGEWSVPILNGNFRQEVWAHDTHLRIDLDARKRKDDDPMSPIWRFSWFYLLHERGSIVLFWLCCATCLRAESIDIFLSPLRVWRRGWWMLKHLISTKSSCIV